MSKIGPMGDKTDRNFFDFLERIDFISFSPILVFSSNAKIDGNKTSQELEERKREMTLIIQRLSFSPTTTPDLGKRQFGEKMNI